ncbi:oxygenase MpaB family protein [Nocardia sp. CS682]|uniref:oxygenase MpaB family protein n=1 Tax=Nocardia sp. CS682 TaxID=1047172 RepID=UPI0010755221|nr:oxygenase MpaB family protein [Nocardia sp. CS682]QBS39547.1 hypothetical protein DMB37_04770 [Nocardia sp. CS682]
MLPLGCFCLGCLSEGVVMRGYKWLDKEMAKLDPHTEYHEIVRLFGQYRLGEMFLNIGYALNFMDVTMPPHGGDALAFGRKSIDRPQRRFEDSMYFFWTWYLYPPDSAEVRESVRRLNRIHAGVARRLPGAFAHNEDYVQGMCLLAVVPHRLQRYIGLPGFDERLRIAFHLWARDICAQLTSEGDVPVVDFPADFESLADFADDYDARDWERTDNGHQVSEAFIRQFCDRWFPGRWQPIGRAIMLSVVPVNVRRVMQLDDPHPLGELAVKIGLRSYFLVQRLLPDPRTPIQRRRIGRKDSPTLRKLKTTGGLSITRTNRTPPAADKDREMSA